MARKPKTKARPAPPPAMEEALPARQLNKQVREMLKEALEALGGVEWLVAFARESDANARVFLSAITRLIPVEVTGRDGVPLSIVIQSADGTVTPIELNPPPIEVEGQRLQ